VLTRTITSTRFRLGKMGNPERLDHTTADFIAARMTRRIMTIGLFDKVAQLFRLRSGPQRLLASFDQHRDSLQQQFFRAASTAGTPRGLRWVRCDWRSERILLRDLSDQSYCLLVSVGISFEALEGSDMEHVAAVSQLRDACAVFQSDGNRWTAGGRVLFNMDPAAAPERLGPGYEVLTAEKT